MCTSPVDMAVDYRLLCVLTSLLPSLTIQGLPQHQKMNQSNTVNKMERASKVSI